MEGVAFAMSVRQETNSLTEEQEGNVTSCCLCDGKKLAAVSSLTLIQDSVAEPWLILGTYLSQVKLLLPELGVGGLPLIQVIKI